MENKPQLTTERPGLVSIKDTMRKLGGIARSTVYVLIANGDIRSVQLRARGNIRGRRMVLTESIEDYLERLKASAN